MNKDKQRRLEDIKVLEDLIEDVKLKQKEYDSDGNGHTKGLLMGKLEALEAVHILLKFNSFIGINRLGI